MKKPFVILGNPENRRVSLFQAALATQGYAPAQVVSWLEFLRNPSALDLPIDECFFRIDAAGENFEVEKELLRLGGAEVEALKEDRGRILWPRRQHEGFEKALARLRLRPGWRALNPVPDILELFDKRRTSARYAAAGIPVPESLGEITTVAQLDAAMEAQGVRAVFVKMSAASSASCLGIYRRPGSFQTTIEVAKTGWYNNLRIQHVRDRGRIEELIGFLLSEGAQVERAIPKAKLAGAFFDLRVLCIAGEPAFVVVRQNAHEITNLHLGGRRGDLEALQAEVPVESWDAAMASCRKVASLYTAHHVGIDLMFEPGCVQHRVLEANAFGDLLPNLTRDGLNVWEYELRALDAMMRP